MSSETINSVKYDVLRLINFVWNEKVPSFE